MRCECLLEVGKITQENRVKVAAIHLEVIALQWHQGYIKVFCETIYGSWDNYVNAFSAKFRSQVYDDPITALRNLKQRDSLQEYMNAFDSIHPKTSINLEQSLSFFFYMD